MGLSKEEEGRQFRVIYEAFYGWPRIFVKDMAELLHISPEMASNKIKKAILLGWISRPQIRRRIFANLKEFVYILRCKNPVKFFSEFVDDENIIYHALTGGPGNLWVVTKKEMDFQCDVLINGLRSDYHVSFAPDYSQETSMNYMWKAAREFNLKDYEPEGIIKSHRNETIEWDSEYEKLFGEFNHDLTKPISPIMKRNLISWTKVEKWLKNLSSYCTIITHYYPGGIKSYDPYLFMFETDYEDFMINLLSKLPTTALFFKVSDMLFSLAYIKREYIRVVNSQTHILKLQIPSLMAELREKGIIRNEAHGIVECYWNSDP